MASHWLADGLYLSTDLHLELGRGVANKMSHAMDWQQYAKLMVAIYAKLMVAIYAKLMVAIYAW